MSTYSDTIETPKKGGLLSRMFNKIADTFKEIKNEYKSQVSKANQETEYDRQSRIQSLALSEIEHGASDAETVKAYKKFLAENKDIHEFGKIDANEILLMKQKIKTGEITPRVSHAEQNATLEA